MLRISRIIKETRLAKDISSEELSKHCNISRPTLISIEKGSDRVIFHTLNKVLNALELDIEIIPKTNEPPPNGENEPRVRVARRKN